ncbi:MerR family transcriptional regulator [Streptomyces sp. NPDC087512]|uniref:MerR family transcriptional regulator n=1 Tax=Streptomyces sp. NPDC087512 TaxID=3155059 RepID=UPI003442D59E
MRHRPRLPRTGRTARREQGVGVTRSAGGHRRYDRSALERLRLLCALRAMGMLLAVATEAASGMFRSAGDRRPDPGSGDRGAADPLAQGRPAAGAAAPPALLGGVGRGRGGHSCPAARSDATSGPAVRMAARVVDRPRVRGRGPPSGTAGRA